jgi:hypothetical protein
MAMGHPQAEPRTQLNFQWEHHPGMVGFSSKIHGLMTPEGNTS